MHFAIFPSTLSDASKSALRSLARSLEANPNSDYLLPDEIIEKTIAKYKEAYTLLSGKEL